MWTSTLLLLLEPTRGGSRTISNETNGKVKPGYHDKIVSSCAHSSIENRTVVGVKHSHRLKHPTMHCGETQSPKGLRRSCCKGRSSLEEWESTTATTLHGPSTATRNQRFSCSASGRTLSVPMTDGGFVPLQALCNDPVGDEGIALGSLRRLGSLMNTRSGDLALLVV
jgi:hypothetical protein